MRVLLVLITVGSIFFMLNLFGCAGDLGGTIKKIDAKVSKDQKNPVIKMDSYSGGNNKDTRSINNDMGSVITSDGGSTTLDPCVNGSCLDPTRVCVNNQCLKMCNNQMDTCNYKSDTCSDNEVCVWVTDLSGGCIPATAKENDLCDHEQKKYCIPGYQCIGINDEPFRCLKLCKYGCQDGAKCITAEDIGCDVCVVP